MIPGRPRRCVRTKHLPSSMPLFPVGSSARGRGDARRRRQNGSGSQKTYQSSPGARDCREGGTTGAGRTRGPISIRFGRIVRRRLRALSGETLPAGAGSCAGRCGLIRAGAVRLPHPHGGSVCHGRSHPGLIPLPARPEGPRPPRLHARGAPRRDLDHRSAPRASAAGSAVDPRGGPHDRLREQPPPTRPGGHAVHRQPARQAPAAQSR